MSLELVELLENVWNVVKEYSSEESHKDIAEELINAFEDRGCDLEDMSELEVYKTAFPE